MKPTEDHSHSFSAHTLNDLASKKSNPHGQNHQRNASMALLSALSQQHSRQYPLQTHGSSNSAIGVAPDSTNEAREKKKFLKVSSQSLLPSSSGLTGRGVPTQKQVQNSNPYSMASFNYSSNVFQAPPPVGRASQGAKQGRDLEAANDSARKKSGAAIKVMKHSGNAAT